MYVVKFATTTTTKKQQEKPQNFFCFNFCIHWFWIMESKLEEEREKSNDCFFFCVKFWNWSLECFQFTWDQCMKFGFQSNFSKTKSYFTWNMTKRMFLIRKKKFNLFCCWKKKIRKIFINSWLTHNLKFESLVT